MLIQVILLLSLFILLITTMQGIQIIRRRENTRIPWGMLLLGTLIVPILFKLYRLNFGDDKPDLLLGQELLGLATSALILIMGQRVFGELRAVRREQQTLQSEKQALESRVALHTRDLQVEAAERERIAHALVQSEDRMRLVVQNLPVMVLALDDNNRCTMWNRECERVTGYSAAEITQNSRAFKLFFPDPAYRRWMFDQLIEHPNFRDLELTITTKNGDERIVAWSNVSTQLPVPGWALWVMGIDVTERKLVTIALHEAREKLELQVTQRTQELRKTNDQLQNEVTQRQRAEIALRQSQNQLRTTLDTISDMVYVVDANLRITLVNERFHAWSQELALETQPIGRTLLELFPFFSSTLHDEYRQVFATGEMLVTEETLPVGTLKLVTETRKIPVIENGTVTHVVTVTRDVTGSKAAHEQAFQLAIEKERGTLLTGFIRDVSHEFANPFSVIKNSAYLVRHVADPVRRKHYLDLINGQIFHVEKLVAGMLTMSRLDSGIPLERAVIDFHTALPTVQADLAHVLAEKNLDLVCAFANGAPGPLPDDFPTLTGDPYLMHTALHNLLENAILYTPAGGTITLRAKHTSAQITLEVIDTGIGIAPDDLPHIFERFFRVDKARTERGAGLGLPIARAIIERHGGTLTADSRLGVGSTFRIELPLDV